MSKRDKSSFVDRWVQRVLVAGGATFLTLSFFLVLPLIQSITKPPTGDLALYQMDTAQLPPPPPPPEPEPEPEEEEEQEPEPPQLEENMELLDLSQLELALDPGFGDSWMTGDFAIKLDNLAQNGSDNDALFSLADLDQKPRVVYQPSPVLSAKARKEAPGTVYVLFVVDQEGRVKDATVQNATAPALERPALDAVKQWRFEPGKRNGQPVRFRMRVPITFPAA